ncbi:MAG TPA: dipeptide epimerase [Chitinophagaceae bacterium]
MKVRYWKYDLRFRYPFTISKGTKTHQPTFIVELEHLGFRGYGEAPAISYYNITVEKMISDLEMRRPFVEKFAFTEPDRYWHYLHHLFPQNPFLVCALDMAGWDLFGKMKRKPLRSFWPATNETILRTDYTIGIDAPDVMQSKIREKPWPVYKIKVGTEKDIETLTLLRQVTPSVFRVDANAGWDMETAKGMIRQLKELNVELIEQPLAKDSFEEMKELYGLPSLPLFADESCVGEADVDRCEGAFHGINIKLTKCGGITPALRMISRARELGLRIMLGCMNESTVGSAAIGQLMHLADYLDMDGPLLLAEDVAEGISYDNGKVDLSGDPGLGIRFTGPI